MFSSSFRKFASTNKLDFSFLSNLHLHHHHQQTSCRVICCSDLDDDIESGFVARRSVCINLQNSIKIK